MRYERHEAAVGLRLYIAGYPEFAGSLQNFGGAFLFESAAAIE
jgi:hypothetical protein